MMIDKETSILLETAILNDGKFIAEVYKLRKSNKTVKEISKILGHKNSMTVTQFNYAIEALFSSVPVDQLKHQSHRYFSITAKRLLESSDNKVLNIYLDSLLKSDSRAITENIKENLDSTVIINSVSQEVLNIGAETTKSGVYVYSYPQYLSMETISPDGKALYKIGASKDIDKRTKRQRRQTEVPEDLILVRAFHCENAFETENKFHKILAAANLHHKNTLGGSEWFNCNLATIDAIANALDLQHELEML